MYRGASEAGEHGQLAEAGEPGHVDVVIADACAPARAMRSMLSVLDGVSILIGRVSSWMPPV